MSIGQKQIIEPAPKLLDNEKIITTLRTMTKEEEEEQKRKKGFHTLNHLVETLPRRKVMATSERRENPIVFFELTIGKEVQGIVLMELFGQVCPRTAENFRSLCTGERKTKEGRQLTYEGSPFHRIVPGFVIQGGDITKGNGTGGESIYGDKFTDENFTHRHSAEGALSMANAGPNTNNSQFFITLRALPHLDRKHVVFGRVLQGLEMVRKISEMRTDKNDSPVQRVFISKCGQRNKPVPLIEFAEEHKEVKTTKDEEKEKELQQKELQNAEWAFLYKQRHVMEQAFREKTNREIKEDGKTLQEKLKVKKRPRQTILELGEADKDEDLEQKASEKGVVRKSRRIFY